MPRGTGAGLPYSERKLRNEKFAQGLLWCACCTTFQPLKRFYKINSHSRYTNYGYRFYCTSCENSKKRNKQRLSQIQRERFRELKAQFVELAGGKCQRCGYKKFNSALQFHHVYPNDKKLAPTTAIYNNDSETTWKELDKCCLLCSNCHLTYEASEWRAEFIKRKGLGWTVGNNLPLDDNRYNQRPQQVQETPAPQEFRKPQNKQLKLLEHPVAYIT